MKILLVDDTQLFLDLGKSYLDRESFEVSTASSGQEALDRVRSWRPDLVIMDLHMPGMKGDAVCRELKSDPAVRRIPVIMVSAASDREAEERCLKAGADAFVAKPLRRDLLLEAVEKVALIAKRRYPRVPTHIMCTITDGDREQAGSITSLSEGGLYIELTRAPEPGQRIDVRFTLAGLGRQIEVGAVVQWRGPFRRGTSTGIGVRFAGIAEPDRAAIADHVENRIQNLLRPRSG